MLNSSSNSFNTEVEREAENEERRKKKKKKEMKTKHKIKVTIANHSFKIWEQSEKYGECCLKNNAVRMPLFNCHLDVAYIGYACLCFATVIIFN